MKIYLSPSNQNANTYSYGNTNEMEQCNRIAEACEIALKRNGYEVKRAPKGQDMNTSIKESNSWGSDLHVPIHTNAGGSEGSLVMIYSTAKENMKYAKPVYNELLAITGAGFGVRLDTDVCGYHLAEVINTKGICIYVEAEFHDNKDLAKWIIENVEAIGEAICKGICKADGKTYKPKEEYFYRVQTGAYLKLSSAEAEVKKLEKLGYNPFIVKVKK